MGWATTGCGSAVATREILGFERSVAWRPQLPTDGGWGGARPVDVARPMAATATLLTW